ncbi:magnesium/cobalt transporter CorA [Desulfoluna sp.]|uniref:magnesium/cobalt transporter CorA n=1 Tax=Desulfoluna sp. TaxID=2045199 RepID=UPI002605183E|nr:magnesium/cobalt transporter CorA [Desulfoluna sp.]
MARFLKNKDAAMGKAPGEMIFIGSQKVQQATLHVIDYDREHLTEIEIADIKEGRHFKETDTVTWININGLHETDVIRDVGQAFGLHPLVIEDILNTGQRPKMEEYDDTLFFTLKIMTYDEKEERIHNEQLSMVLGRTFLLTFQERPGDVFEPVRERIRKHKGRIRGVGIDYLAYALLDTVVDKYIFIIERIGEQIEEIEDEILENPTPAILAKINTYKREMNYVRKTIRPAREFILHLSRLDSDLIDDPTAPFLKDLLDLATQAVEVIDTYREMLSDHLNIFNTGISNRLNEIMKVLTIFSAIFIPLTFIAGIYGTNFEYVPELHFRYSYFIFWVVLLGVAVTMIRFFKRRNWL